jgi:hypothetical protein
VSEARAARRVARDESLSSTEGGQALRDAAADLTGRAGYPEKLVGHVDHLYSVAVNPMSEPRRR